MIGGITGQHDWWTQTAANRPPPISLSTQNSGQNASQSAVNRPATPASTPRSGTNPVAGGATAPLSDSMSFALMVFGNGEGRPQGGLRGRGNDAEQSGNPVAPSQAAGPDSAASPGSASRTTTGADTASKLFGDLQSLFSALTGSSANNLAQPTSSSATTSGTGTSSSTGSSSATSLSSTVLQDLQTISSDLEAIASMSGSPQTENATSQGSRWSPPADDAVRNEKFGTPGGFDHHKQLALAAYAAGSSVSSLSKTPMSQLASIST